MRAPHLIEIVVPDVQAYELFENIYETAGIGREGGGVIWMSGVIDATPYALPPKSAARRRCSRQSPSPLL